MAMNSNGWIRRDVLVLARDHILPRASKISSLFELEKGADSVQVRQVGVENVKIGVNLSFFYRRRSIVDKRYLFSPLLLYQ